MTPLPPEHPGSDERALDREAIALQTAVADLVRIYQVRDRERICRHDISVTQCHALETLVQHGHLRLNALAERLFLDKSTTSRVVSALVRKGYVAQRADASDARATTLIATRKGYRLWTGITEDLVAQQREVLQDLDPAVRPEVVQVLRLLTQAARGRLQAGSPDAAAGSAIE